MKLNFAGQTLQTLRFENKADLQLNDPALFAKVRDSVFAEYDPALAAVAAKWDGTVVYGDVRFPFVDHEEGCFRAIYDALGEDYGKTLVFAGSLDVEMGLGLDDRERVVVLGDVTAVGISNVQSELWIDGRTTLRGGLYFDSDNGGFTKLNLAEPAGFIATSANQFDIELRAHYFFDPLFRCSFGAAPTTPHEARIQSAFRAGERPTQITLDDLADFFVPMSDEVSEEVRAGDYAPWLDTLMANLDARKFVHFLDQRYR